jgi:hypothetical protein
MEEERHLEFGWLMCKKLKSEVDWRKCDSESDEG